VEEGVSLQKIKDYGFAQAYICLTKIFSFENNKVLQIFFKKNKFE
jgi:hypothetical protein